MPIYVYIVPGPSSGAQGNFRGKRAVACGNDGGPGGTGLRFGPPALVFVMVGRVTWMGLCNSDAPYLSKLPVLLGSELLIWPI